MPLYLMIEIHHCLFADTNCASKELAGHWLENACLSTSMHLYFKDILLLSSEMGLVDGDCHCLCPCEYFFRSSFFLCTLSVSFLPIYAA